MSVRGPLLWGALFLFNDGGATAVVVWAVEMRSGDVESERLGSGSLGRCRLAFREMETRF